MSVVESTRWRVSGKGVLTAACDSPSTRWVCVMWGEWEHFPSCVLESLKGLKRKTDEGSMLLFGRGVDGCVSLNSVSGNILHVHSSLFSNSARLDDGWLPLLHATGMVLGSGRWLLVDRQLDGWMDGWLDSGSRRVEGTSSTLALLPRRGVCLKSSRDPTVTETQ